MKETLVIPDEAARGEEVARIKSGFEAAHQREIGASGGGRECRRAPNIYRAFERRRTPGKSGAGILFGAELEDGKAHSRETTYGFNII